MARDDTAEFVATFIFFGMLGVFALRNILPVNKNFENNEKIFEQHMDTLAAEFPAQFSDSWHELRSQLGNTLPQHWYPNPAVITAILPLSMEVGFANCFLKKVAFTVNQAVAVISGKIPILPILLTTSTLEKQDIRRKFGKLGNFVGNPIILLNEDLIKSRTDLELLKDLWTNTTAFGSRPTVIFIIRAPDELEYGRHRSRKWEIPHKVLTHAWEHINDNIKYDLISRLSTSVVLLNQGDLCTDYLTFSDSIAKFEPSLLLAELHNTVYRINQHVTNPLFKNAASIKKGFIELEEQFPKLSNQLEYFQIAYKQLTEQYKWLADKNSEILQNRKSERPWWLPSETGVIEVLQFIVPIIYAYYLISGLSEIISDWYSAVVEKEKTRKDLIYYALIIVALVLRVLL